MEEALDGIYSPATDFLETDSESQDSVPLTTTWTPGSYGASGSGISMADICYWYDYIVYIIVIPILCVCGFVGNYLTRLALWTDRAKSATVFLLICLSFVDDSVLVIYGFMLSGYMLAYVDSVQDTRFPEAYSRIWNFGWALASTTQVTASWMLLVISVQRYIGVCHPLISKSLNTVRSARLIVVCTLLGSMIYNFPRFFKYERFVHPITGRTYNVLTKLGSSHSYRVVYELLFYYALVYALPMIVLLYTTVKLLMALRQSKRKRAQMTSNSQNSAMSKLQDEVTRSVVGVVVLFCVCQLANPTRRILDETLSAEQKSCGTFYDFYAPITGLAVIFNSAINFIVFCVCARGFRRQLLVKLRGKSKVGDSTASTGTSGRRFGTTTTRGTRVTPMNATLSGTGTDQKF